MAETAKHWTHRSIAVPPELPAEPGDVDRCMRWCQTCERYYVEIRRMPRYGTGAVRVYHLSTARGGEQPTEADRVYPH